MTSMDTTTARLAATLLTHGKAYLTRPETVTVILRANGMDHCLTRSIACILAQDWPQSRTHLCIETKIPSDSLIPLLAATGYLSIDIRDVIPDEVASMNHSHCF